MADAVFTIGYTGFTPDEFISALKAQGISLVVDVRSTPYSQRFPDYNKENLQAILKESGIYYRNYADEFGARQPDLDFYPNGYLDFDLFSKSERFLSGIEKLKNAMANGYIFALMCSEKNPVMCHRAILVSRALYQRGYKVVHLLPNGETITQKAIEEQLLDKYYPDRDQLSMFTPMYTREEYVAMAYKKQNEVIGYKIGEENL